MQRKATNRTQKAEAMPFQTNKDKMNSQGWGYNSAEIAKAALPIFGGTYVVVVHFP